MKLKCIYKQYSVTFSIFSKKKEILYDLLVLTQNQKFAKIILD